VTGLFYNPNIQPETEYRKRLEEAKRYFKDLGILLIEGTYDPQNWNDLTAVYRNEPEGGKRCNICYRIRLQKTAEMAELNNFEFFTTTLSISPYKDAKKLNKLGKLVSTGLEVNYIESNFKKHDGYKKSIQMSKESGLYRQNYCGCEYSKKERENRKKK